MQMLQRHCIVALLPLLFPVVHADSVAVGASGATIDPDCRDDHDQCETWAADGECTANAGFMLSSCRKSCYACQSADCHNDDEQCERWAEAGECARNEGYMISGCAHACRICFVNQTAACRRATDATPAARAGTIDSNFERLVNGPRESPRPLARVLHREPWIVAFDDFLSAAEADELVRVSGHNFEQSRFLGDDKMDGRENPRTSTTSWCNVPSCLSDPTFQRIRGRISDLVGVPWAHSEHLQLLRYERGQYYRDHHDQIAPPDSAWGPRLYTFFMYLSDVEEGGGTRFTKLNLTVAPVKGMAILWPSVLSSDVIVTDERTHHEALPVVKGLKFAANFWIHLYDFQAFHALGCDNRNYLQTDTLARRGAPPNHRSKGYSSDATDK